MASLSVLTLKEGILPLVSSFNTEDVRTVKVEHSWTPANQEAQHAKMYLPVCDDPSNKELFLYVIDQFIDASDNDRLHLSTGNVRYSKFRSVLGGDLRLKWQELSNARANKSVESFLLDQRALIATYLAPSSFDDEREYIRSVTKPFSMSCDALGVRLRVISHLSQ